MNRKGFSKQNPMTHFGCLPFAIQRDGRTLSQIMADISIEKEIEINVLNLYAKGMKYQAIAKSLNITTGKAKHIIEFDRLGLSYRKINKNETKPLQAGQRLSYAS